MIVTIYLMISIYLCNHSETYGSTKCMSLLILNTVTAIYLLLLLFNRTVQNCLGKSMNSIWQIMHHVFGAHQGALRPEGAVRASTAELEDCDKLQTGMWPKKITVRVKQGSCKWNRVYVQNILEAIESIKQERIVKENNVALGAVWPNILVAAKGTRCGQPWHWPLVRPRDTPDS